MATFQQGYATKEEDEYDKVGTVALHGWTVIFSTAKSGTNG